MGGKFFSGILAIAVSLMLSSTASAAAKQWYYPNVDGDLYGDSQSPGVYTNKPGVDCPGCLTNNADCDDSDGAVYPGATELCDGIANDCSAPGWPALPVTEVDNDGDDYVECNVDVGGWYGAAITGGGDCDDSWVACYPGAPECVCTPVNQVASVGQIWMDRNLGASQVATSSTDSAAYGDLYQWGRAADGHQLRGSATTSTLSSTDNPGHGDFIAAPASPYDWRSPQNDNLWQGVSGINNPCPAGFRLPADTELLTEMASWGSQDASGAFASPLKFTMGGYRWNTGSYWGIGSWGMYWSSTINSTWDNSRHLWFFNTNADLTSEDRSSGFSVRCIMD